MIHNWPSLGIGEERSYRVRLGRTVTQEMRRLHKVFHRWKYRRGVNAVMRRISVRRSDKSLILTRVQ